VKNIELLKQKKGGMVTEARTITGLSEKENRNLTTEEKAKVDKILADTRELDGDIEREERLANHALGGRMHHKRCTVFESGG